MKKWIFASLLLLLTGCSIKTLYSWLDWLIPWKVDEYVSLTSQQEQWLDRSLTKHLHWHKHNELAVYLRQLESWQQEVQQPLTPPQVLAQIEAVSANSQRVLQQILPDLVALAQTLSDKQVDEIENNLLEKLRENKADFDKLTPARRIEGASKKISKNIRQWLGRLNESQQMIIEDYARARQSTAAPWFAYRQDWITQFIAALEQRALGSAFLTEQFTTLLIYPERLKGQEYLAVINNNRKQLAQGIVDIHAKMTPWQHRTLQRKLTGLNEDLSELLD